MARLWSKHRLKSRANAEAVRARRKGYKARIVRLKKGYAVYVSLK